MTPKLIKQKVLSNGYVKLRRLTFQMPDGRTKDLEVGSHGMAVGVLPYDPDRRCALVVRQFRAPVMLAEGRDWFEEACAGMIDGAAAADDTARREAMEELGLRLGELDLIARIWPSPGISSEQVSLFLAAYGAGDRVAAGGGLAEEHEHIEVVERALADLAAEAAAGRIEDAKLLTLILALQLKRPELFTAAAA